MAQYIGARNDEEEILVHEISNPEAILEKRRHRVRRGQTKHVKGRAHFSEHVVEAEGRAQVWQVKQTEGFFCTTSNTNPTNKARCDPPCQGLEHQTEIKLLVRCATDVVAAGKHFFLKSNVVKGQKLQMFHAIAFLVISTYISYSTSPLAKR